MSFVHQLVTQRLKNILIYNYESLSIITSLEMAILHVKIVWLSVATITTFFYGSWKRNYADWAVWTMIHTTILERWKWNSSRRAVSQNSSDLETKYYFSRRISLSTVESVDLLWPVVIIVGNLISNRMIPRSVRLDLANLRNIVFNVSLLSADSALWCSTDARGSAVNQWFLYSLGR